MLKGVNNRVIELVDIDNEYFERAILFVRPNGGKSDGGLIKTQAEQFITGMDMKPPRVREKSRSKRIAAFLAKWGAAAAFGALIATLLLKF